MAMVLKRWRRGREPRPAPTKNQFNDVGLKAQPDVHSLRLSPCAFRLQQGFTLIEMILVMVIAIFILGAVGPRISSGIGTVKFRSAAQNIASALRQTRALAVAEEREAMLSVFLDERVYTVDNVKRYAFDLPEDTEIIIDTTTDQVFAGGDRGDFTFYPDGSASGGRITLIYHGQRRLIDINWLTGLVEILEEHP